MLQTVVKARDEHAPRQCRFNKPLRGGVAVRQAVIRGVRLLDCGNPWSSAKKVSAAAVEWLGTFASKRSRAGSVVDLLGVYSKKVSLRDRLADLGKHFDRIDKRPVRRPRSAVRHHKLTRRLSESEVQALVTSYESGTSSNQLVTDFGIAKGTVLKLLRSHGVTIRNQGLCPEALGEAVDRYESGQSLATIAAVHEVSPMTVRKALLAGGVRTRDRHGDRGTYSAQ